jgi:hypothetical protein
MSQLYDFGAIVIIPEGTDPTRAITWFNEKFGEICRPNMFTVTPSEGGILTFTAETSQAIDRTLIRCFLGVMEKIGEVSQIRYHTYLSGKAPLTEIQATKFRSPDDWGWHKPSGKTSRP